MSHSPSLVLVAMSGGVDSAVAAARVQQLGHPLLGVTMKLWDYAEVGGSPGPGEDRCCSLESIEGARSSADILGIPHYVMDMTVPFRETVVADFISEYREGRTPNPCVVCNNRIKWSALYDRALAVGAARMATGHYARIRFNADSGRYELWRGIDATRDQSYVLYGLTQAQLAVTMFPLGEMLKSDVRALAHDLGLPVADRAESREICFVTDDNYRRFLQEKLAPDDPAGQAGPIVDEQGRTVGEHQGFVAFTVGQRRGLNLALGCPYYVRRIDPATRTVHIAPESHLFARRLRVRQTNWVSIAPPTEPIPVTAKIRYQHAGAEAMLKVLSADELEIEFREPQRALTPGQSAVFYAAERVLGGGLIASASQ